MGVIEVIALTLTLPAPSAPPSLPRWERDFAPAPLESGKGEGDGGEGAYG